MENSKINKHRHVHKHTHTVTDPILFTTQRGIWAVKWSFLGLLVTAIIQLFVVYFSGSVALFADMIHNISDASTAISLWLAFKLMRRKPNKSFTYGYGRVEDLAGVFIVLTILFSVIVAGYESVNCFFHPHSVEYLWAVILASIIGFIGNEAVARFRMKVGKEIGSAALIADGYHARVDGFTSLAVLFGAFGVWFGYPLADPVVGGVISIAILRIVYTSGKTVFIRLLDGVDPEVIDEIKHSASQTHGVKDITEIRVRWSGHRMHAELNIAVDPGLTIEKGHNIAQRVRHKLLHQLKYLSIVTIHIDPVNTSGEEFHHIDEHKHGNFPLHSHE